MTRPRLLALSVALASHAAPMAAQKASTRRHSRRDRGSSAPTTSSSTHGSMPFAAELDRACGPAPAEACQRARRHGALVAHPARSRQPRARREFSTSVERRFARPTSGPSVSPTMPRRGSTSAARTPPECSGACSATSGSPLPVTASGSRRRSSVRSRSIPISTTPTSASACIRYYADVAPTAAKILRFLLLLPGGNREEGLAQMLRAREPRAPAPGRGRLPAAHHLSLVRAPHRSRARAASRSRPPSSGESALPDADRGDSGRLSARHHGEPRELAGAPRRRHGRPRGICRSSRRSAPGSALPVTSTRSR